MKKWKRAAACVCVAVLICYSMIMGLINNSLIGFGIPLLCAVICGFVCVLLRILPGVRTKKRLQLAMEAVIVAAVAVCMILFL